MYVSKSLKARPVIGCLLTVALGIIFIFSGLSKLAALKSFSWAIIDVLPITELWAGIVARVVISIEMLLGAFLVLQVALRPFTYRAALFLLLLFTVYLVVSVFNTGNAGNCGCFGNWLSMTPGAAIAKNLAMMLGIIVCYAIYHPRSYNGVLYAAALVATATVVAPFVVHPVYVNEEEEFKKEAVDLNPLYKKANPIPALDARKGKHIIGLFSLTCPHCKKAGEKMQQLYTKDHTLALQAVLNGPSGDIQEFLKDAKITTLPYTYLSDDEAFQKMAGKFVPQIFWMNNGMRVRKIYYSDLDYTEIKSWLATP